MLLWLFWMAVAFIIFTYAGFPLMLALRALLRPRFFLQEDITPTVSLIIAAYNEERDIVEKLENVLILDYPREQLQVIVASDGSTDATNQLAAAYEARCAHIRLLALPRLGKAGALNAAAAKAVGEILVFSDANSHYAPSAINQLVRPFADPSVGGVAGDQRYISPSKDASGSGEKSYWNFDRLLKLWESRGGSVISATGAIYAIRRDLFRGVPEGVTDDFVTSTRVIAQGKRLVFAPDAVAYEPVSKSVTREFGRKVRIMTRGLNAVVMMKELANPLRHGFYALQFISHKILRRLVFIPLIVLITVSPFLLKEGLIFQAAFAAQVGFYGLALLGFAAEKIGKRLPKFTAVPFYVTMVYLAAMIASLNVLLQRQVTSWKPQRS